MKRSKLIWCHITGGAENLNYHTWLSRFTVEYLRNKGYKVRICNN